MFAGEMDASQDEHDVGKSDDDCSYGNPLVMSSNEGKARKRLPLSRGAEMNMPGFPTAPASGNIAPASPLSPGDSSDLGRRQPDQSDLMLLGLRKVKRGSNDHSEIKARKL